MPVFDVHDEVKTQRFEAALFKEKEDISIKFFLWYLYKINILALGPNYQKVEGQRCFLPALNKEVM